MKSIVITLILVPMSLAQLPDERDWILPNERFMVKQIPITFVTSKEPEWGKLNQYWNILEKEVKVKVPLGLDQGPPSPQHNFPTWHRWRLGKQLFFDPVLSSNGTIACVSCHDPQRGYSRPTKVAIGIDGRKGNMNAPTLFNVGYNKVFFWDGRAKSLEEQIQVPVADFKEMFDGNGDAWHKAVERVRAKRNYKKTFMEAYGSLPTRDTIAKALAVYLRTILTGNSNVDRGSTRGLALYKQHCASCHSGPNYTDNYIESARFHDLKLGGIGHFGALPFGQKDNKQFGRYKTPTLRNLRASGPYFHDGRFDSLSRTVYHLNSTLGLNLTLLEQESLLHFLSDLQGEPLPPVIFDPR